MIHTSACLCCTRRPFTAAPSCDCGPGLCQNCMRCEAHCGCPFDLRQLCYDDDAPEALPEPDAVMERDAEIARLHAFTLRVADRLASAAECLGRVAERRERRSA